MALLLVASQAAFWGQRLVLRQLPLVAPALLPSVPLSMLSCADKPTKAAQDALVSSRVDDRSQRSLHSLTLLYVVPSSRSTSLCLQTLEQRQMAGYRQYRASANTSGVSQSSAASCRSQSSCPRSWSDTNLDPKWFLRQWIPLRRLLQDAWLSDQVKEQYSLGP